MKVTLYYKGMAAFLSLFVLLIVSPTCVGAADVDIKPCYECLNCVINEATLEPEPPEGQIAEWEQCSDLPAINLCSNGLTVVGVIDFEIDELAEVAFLGAPSLRYSVEDVDHDGQEDDVVYFFKTKELDMSQANDNLDGSFEACLVSTSDGGAPVEVGCDSVVLFEKGRCDKEPKKLKKAHGKKPK